MSARHDERFAAARIDNRAGAERAACCIFDDQPHRGGQQSCMRRRCSVTGGQVAVPGWRFDWHRTLRLARLGLLAVAQAQRLHSARGASALCRRGLDRAIGRGRRFARAHFVLRPVEHLLQALAAVCTDLPSISWPLTSITKQGICVTLYCCEVARRAWYRLRGSDSRLARSCA